MKPPQRYALVGLAMSMALLVALPVAIWLVGAAGALAAASAAATIVVASVAGMLLAGSFPGPANAWVRLMVSMLVRMFLPLVACLIVYLAAPSLAAAGFVYFVLAFYLLALPVETMIALAAIEQPKLS